MGVAMRIYRIEVEDGYGCYTSGKVFEAGMVIGRDNEGAEKDNRPSPYNDGLDHFSRSYDIFGFASQEQMEDWFDREFLVAMQELGAQLAIYEVPKEHVKHGSRQVVFDKRFAYKVETGDLV